MNRSSDAMNDPVDRMLHDISQGGAYDALTEIASQLNGLLLAREDAAANPAVRKRLQEERQAIRRRMRDIDPHSSTEVELLISEWGGRLQSAIEPHAAGRR
jgi:hypothetical protein